MPWITCPECEDEIEFTLDGKEDRPIVADWKRDCPCVFTEAEEEALIEAAEKSIEEMDPPGEY